MHIVVTGANGFVGQQLVQNLLNTQSKLNGFTRLSLIDLHFSEYIDDSRVHYFQGDFSEITLIDSALSHPAQIVFHLASIPGGMAEKNYDLSRKVNLDSMIYLIEKLKSQTEKARMVFASTIAVYGSDLPEIITDESVLKPNLTYAAQKLMGEILIDDFSRHGWLDGVSVRLPGIVARPPTDSGLLSSFMSNIFWLLSKGEKFRCPISSQATAWWMSVQCCAENLIHAANLTNEQLASGNRAFTLPVLRFSLAEVANAICDQYGFNVEDLVEYDTNIELEKNFGSYPNIETSRANSLGFRHDGNLSELIQRALTSSSNF